MKLINNWQKTGIVAVDMVASAVSYLRKGLKPVKTIYLNPKLYYQFEYWVSRNMTEEEFYEARESGFQFDGINIEKQSDLLINDINWDFYEDNAQA